MESEAVESMDSVSVPFVGVILIVSKEQLSLTSPMIFNSQGGISIESI